MAGGWSIDMLHLVLVLLSLPLLICQGFELQGSQNSYALFSSWSPCANGSINFNFKTDRPNALLLYADDVSKLDYVELKLVGGTVRLRMKYGKTALITNLGYGLHDLRWHSVELRRKGLETIFLVDGLREIHVQRGPGMKLNFGTPGKISKLFIGGMPEAYGSELSKLALPSVVFEPSFKGSIRNLTYVNCGNRPEKPEMLEYSGLVQKRDLCETDNPCQHGGICSVSDNGLDCDCTSTEYDGPMCEIEKVQLEATFSGAEYLSYDFTGRGDPIVSDEDEVSLHFKTRLSNSLLFYTGDKKDFLNIGLKNGGIIVTINLGSGVFEKEVQRGQSRYDDNQWHHLLVTRKSRRIQITIDGVSGPVDTSTGEFTLLTSSVVYVGGSPNTQALPGSRVARNFKGCMKKVIFKTDSFHLDLTQMAQNGHDLISIIGNVLFNKCEDQKESQPVTFTSPESYIELSSWQVKHKGSMSFEFQTIESNGVMLYNSGLDSQSDFFAIEILDGHLFMLMDLGSGAIKVQASPQRVDDGNLHHLSLEYRGKEGTLVLDDQRKKYTTIGDSGQLDLAGKLYVGGVNDHTDAYMLPKELWAGMLGYGYVGCLQNLILNGKKVDLAHAAQRQMASGIGEYCRSMEPQCLSQPCMFKGTCSEGWNRFICDCRGTGHMGPVCQKVVTTLMFDGTQLLKVTMPDESKTEAEDISLRFKTHRANGLLFLTSSDESSDSMVLTVSSGQVQLSMNVGSGSKVLTQGMGVNDEEWHTVNIRRRARQMELSVDGQSAVSGSLDVEPFTLEIKYIFIGSVEIPVDEELPGSSRILEFRAVEVGHQKHNDNDNTLYGHTSFVGSMQQFIFNRNQFFEMARSGQISNIQVTATINKQEYVIKDPVTFRSPASYARLPHLRVYSVFSLYFQFKTTEANGLIFYNGGAAQDFLAMELVGGKLYFIFSLGSGSKRMLVNSARKLNDNKWHHVSIIRPVIERHIVRVDDNKATSMILDLVNNVHYDLAGFLYLGGVPPSMFHKLPKLVKAKNGFQGCMASLDLNEYLPNIIQEAEYETGSIQAGCRGPVKKCQPDSCLNNGVCVQQWNFYRCDCDMTSFIGPRCDQDSIAYRFGGDNIITYRFPPHKRPSTREDTLALGFSTTEPRAVLVRMESGDSEDYLEMELVGGNIFVVYNMGNQDHPIGELFEKVNDGKYHVVRFTRSGPNSTIQVDNNSIQTKSPRGYQMEEFNSIARVYVGATKDADGRRSRSFRGIISGLVLNGIRILDLYASGDHSVTKEGDVTLQKNYNTRPYRPVQPPFKIDMTDMQSTQGIKLIISTPPVTYDLYTGSNKMKKTSKRLYNTILSKYSVNGNTASKNLQPKLSSNGYFLGNSIPKSKWLKRQSDDNNFASGSGNSGSGYSGFKDEDSMIGDMHVHGYKKISVLPKVEHTTPRQGVTDDIIFSGMGPGCHDSDDEDECISVGSGTDDDIITPAVLFRTTPKPPSTTPRSPDTPRVTEATSGGKQPCDDDDDCEVTGSGVTGKPPIRGDFNITSNNNRPLGATSGPKEMTTNDDNEPGDTGKTVNGDETEPPNIGLILGIAAGVLVALLILIFALYKFRSKDEGSYKIDESQNFAHLEKKQQSNGGAAHGSNGKNSKKKDVKEWYV